MKREIKFRAWSPKYNRFLEPFMYPNGHDGLLLDIETGKLTIQYEDDYEDDEGFMVKVPEKYYQDIILMQYTGLKDRNGKEIYEGDIVRYVSWLNEYSPEEITLVRPVVFRDGSFFPIPKHDECEDGYYSWGLKDFEVIGNIHENPELIK